MAKPFQKNQVGYMRHRKFLALNANAIALWHEGKDYCSEHLTDGLIPREAVKGFRFKGARAIQLLTDSCGAKPDGTAYAPLWERHDVGYKMHDYLEHNDSYEVIQERIGRAEERRDGDRRRAKEYRDRTRERRNGERRHDEDDSSRVTSRVISEAVTGSTVPDTSTPVSVKNTDTGRARPMAPLHVPHKSHVVCGRICLHMALFDEFVRRRNGDRETVRAWATRVSDEWTDGHQDEEPGDAFDFWRARYAEQWPPTASPRSWSAARSAGNDDELHAFANRRPS